ncbi:MAG: metallophosphoesterase [Firmicutes bacterium]|nr:metallophosphoesterase [Bacillota bacterium]
MKFIKFCRHRIHYVLLLTLLTLTTAFCPVNAAQQSKILNGPYLLAPTSNSMTVAWESDSPGDAVIWYGSDGNLENRQEVKVERGTPWKENTEGICLFRATLANLKPNTGYEYKVELASGDISEGSFKTLKENPDSIHLLTISDSHGFQTNKEFSAAVLAEKPDFIIHSGDIPAGTGYQKDKYESCWFNPGKEFLKNFPVVYINGNHDAGPFFEDYFMKSQRSVYNASPYGLNYSFNYGNVHIVMVNSNPWGLYEMNAELSGLTVEQSTLNTIHDSLQWLEKDLQADAAKTAKWRIVVMHHPYTDAFTNKHVISILEDNHVNLMLAGHLHFYEKNVSINPEVGARTVYITQGSAEKNAGEIDYGKTGKRILSEYPEVVAIGKTMYSTLDINGDMLTYKIYGIPKGETIPRMLDVTNLSLEEPKLSLSNVILKVDPENAKKLSFEGTVKNEGSGMAAVVVKMVDNNKETLLNLFGTAGNEQVITLNPGEKKTINRSITLTSPGKHSVRIGNATETLIIPELKDAIELCNVTTRAGKGIDSNVVFAATEVSNLHNTNITKQLDFYVDQQVVSSQNISLAPYEKKVVNFSYRFVQGGTYHVKIGNSESQEVQIEGTLKGTPLAKDLSGHGNDGIIRGNPKIIAKEDGSMSVSLADNYGDYIEIPDSQSLHVQDGFTGIVWSNLNRLSKDGEQERNPMMVKGPSLGWGANYLVRMLVKKSGGNVSWGTCYDNTEYLWEGGKAPIGSWAQYALTFDKATGGTSYIDNKKTAEIGQIKQDVRLRDWEGYPLFIGYAYSGHVIKELGRPKYYAHFPGQVSQVRFYSTKLSADELQYLNDHPKEAGESAENMLVWLNFKDIKTEGIHKTEWRQPSFFKPAFKADKQLWAFKILMAESVVPAGTSLRATIEVSDSPQAIKGSKEIVLLGGKQMIDISDLPKAQYIRIITKFNSVSGVNGTFVPELNLYKVTAEFNNQKTQLTWGTKADWEKGSIDGAVGFEPLNRTKVIEDYTDVIH